MKRIVTHMLVATGLAIGAVGAAQAHSDLHVGVSIGTPAYVAPAPVYVRPTVPTYGAPYYRQNRTGMAATATITAAGTARAGITAATVTTGAIAAEPATRDDGPLDQHKWLATGSAQSGVWPGNASSSRMPNSLRN